MRRLIGLCLLMGVLLGFPVWAGEAVYGNAQADEGFGETEAVDLPLPSTSARGVALIDLSGRILYASRAEERLPMASTTKIMTAIIAIEEGNLDELVTISAAAVGVEGSSAYLMAGEQLSLRDLLYALMLNSANDAAAAIAIYMDGSVEAFAEHMNRKASELELLETHFTNPHGLDDEAHYTSALDLARLTAYALKNPAFAEIVSTIRYDCPLRGKDGAIQDRSRLFVNHNRLLKSYPGAVGVKTGYTKRTGRCLVSAACRDGLTLICVTLGDPDDWKDHAALLDYGFSRYESVTLAKSGEICQTVPAVSAEKEQLSLAIGSDVTAMLPRGSHVELVVECPSFVYGGIEAGKQMGRAVWYCDGREVAETAIYADSDLPRKAYPLSFWQKAANFFRGIGSFLKQLFR